MTTEQPRSAVRPDPARRIDSDLGRPYVGWMASARLTGRRTSMSCNPFQNFTVRFKRGESIFEEDLGPDHSNTKTVRENLQVLK